MFTTPVDRIRCSLVDEWRDPAPGFFPARAAFPAAWPGRHPQLHFRGLLKLHTRYSLHGCSPTFRGLYREAPLSPVSRLERSQAIKSNQQLLEWVLPPLVICAVGAHQAVSIANREVGSGPEFENAARGIMQRILSRAPGRMKDQAYRETGGALLKIPLC